MKNTFLLVPLLIISVLSTAFIKTDNIIFDLGGVLIDTDSMACLSHMGLPNIARCMVDLKKGPLAINGHIKRKFFEVLNNVAAVHQLAFTSDCCAYDEHGTALPYLMCMWLNGSMTAGEIRLLVLSCIEHNPQWFVSQAEKNIVINLVTMVFTPEKFVATRKVYSKGVLFVKACKKYGHKVYVLSNWDGESFALLKNKYSELFDLFDGIIISGDIKMLKPFSGIYAGLLNTYQLDSKKCWFIDDQKENVAAAVDLGINGILCHYHWPIKKPNFSRIAKKINQSFYKSVTRRENFKKSGISANMTKTINNPIIDGENTSLTELMV